MKIFPAPFGRVETAIGLPTEYTSAPVNFSIGVSVPLAVLVLQE